MSAVIAMAEPRDEAAALLEALMAAAGTLRGLIGTLKAGHSPAVSVWSWTSDLLRLLRFHNVRIEPLPFA